MSLISYIRIEFEIQIETSFNSLNKMELNESCF